MKNNLLEILRLKESRLFTVKNFEVFKEFVRANFKIRDHDSFLGFIWSLMGPVLTAMILFFVFRTRFGGEENRLYPLYILSGVVCVNFFITTTVYMVSVFYYNREFVLNSTVPREIILSSGLFVYTYKFFIDLLLCVILSVIYGTFSIKALLLLIPLAIAYNGFVMGVSILLSLIYCFATDIDYIWQVMTRLFYFITPVFYKLSILHPLTANIIYYCNPLTPFVMSFQRLFLGTFVLSIYLHALLVGSVFFVICYWTFIVTENVAMERA